MKLSPTLKWTLAATVAATAFIAWQPDDEEAGAVTTGKAAASRPRVDNVPPAVLSKPLDSEGEEPAASERARAAWAPVDPAALLAWGVPPPEPPPLPAVTSQEPPPPPAPPQAPPFPYTLIGRIDDELGPQWLMTGPMKTIAVRPKDVIDGQWRVDTVQPGGVTVTWLPGSLQQTLSYRAS